MPTAYSVATRTPPTTPVSNTALVSSQSPTKIHKFEKNWGERLEELRHYKKNHGSTSVPAKSERFGSLGKWCEYQRARYNRGALPRDRIDRLKEVGFVFEGNVPRSPEKKFPSYDELWKTHIADLKKFKEEFGHAQVPAQYTVNPELGKWVENQRCAFRRGELKPEKLDELKDAGFVFEVESSPQKAYRSYAYERRFKMRLSELSKYREMHGNCNVPSRYPENPELAKWVENQRGSFKRNELSQWKIDLLKDLEFDFIGRTRGKKSEKTLCFTVL
eukprot:CCRYP_003131-RA/>CCRYP_003131-RA protein AED:0.21 eAED:0.21 QI:109/1/1/1/1/1/2/402/274